MHEYEQRLAKAMSMGDADKLVKRKHAGLFNARERITYLCDSDSFVESGLFATSASNTSDHDKTPADGKIAGFGKIDGRMAAVIANDFTVMGASSSATNGRKLSHMKRVATKSGLPMIFLGESAGARMPDHMGSRGMGTLLGIFNSAHVGAVLRVWMSLMILLHVYGRQMMSSCSNDLGFSPPAPYSAPLSILTQEQRW